MAYLGTIGGVDASTAKRLCPARRRVQRVSGEIVSKVGRGSMSEKSGSKADSREIGSAPAREAGVFATANDQKSMPFFHQFHTVRNPCNQQHGRLIAGAGTK